MENDRMTFLKFRQMRPRKQAEYIWMYYRWHILAVLAALAVLVSLVRQFGYNGREQLISGIFLNTRTSEAGYHWLQEDYAAYCGKPDGRSELIQGRDFHFDDEMPSETDAAVFTILAGMISSKGLDYIITNEATLEYLDGQALLLDLAQLLPADTLAALDTIRTSSGTIAIRLSSTAYGQSFDFYAPDTCLTVVNSTPDKEKTAQFVQYVIGK